MGALSKRIIEVSLTPTITAGAYSANDVVGGRLAFAVPSASGAGFVRAVRVVDDDDEKAASKLYLFSAAPTSINDNAAVSALVLADLKKLIGVVTIANASFASINSNAYLISGGLSIPYTTTDGYLYAYLTCDATPTYTAVTDLTITLTVETV